MVTSERRSRRRLVLAVAAAVGLGLAGCSDDTARTDESTRAPSAPPAADGSVDASQYSWGHVHNLALDGQRLLIGAHHGLFVQEPGTSPTQLSEDAFDVMGLTRAGSGWLASGHPAEGQDAPGHLGLLSSPDAAKWTALSLEGKADFHRLAAAGDTVLGVNSADGHLMRSDDGGKTWIDLGAVSLFDVAVKPADPAKVVASTENGPVRSEDAARTWTPLPGAPLVAFLAWDGTTLYGIDATGRIWSTTDTGTTWVQTGPAHGQPAALAAAAGNLAILVGDTIYTSDDGGHTMRRRITGIRAEQH